MGRIDSQAYILYILWDMGFKVGHATRNIDESIRQSRDDMTVKTSFWRPDSSGATCSFDELNKRFYAEVVRELRREFITAKLASAR
ncbi:MAG: hypothetical protein R3D34_05055 [Nitratireductor sp.]